MTTQTVTLRIVGENGQLVSAIKGSSAELKGLGAAGRDAGAQVDRGAAAASRGMENLARQVTAARQLLIGFFTFREAGRLLFALGRTADAYSNIQAQLRLATSSELEYQRAQRETFAIAQRTSTLLDTTSGLYARITRSVSEYGISQARVLGITETINQSFAVSGASTIAQANAVTQLTQAFAGGVLRAEEFNSIIENSPRLAQALADGLGIGIGALRKQVNDGKVDVQAMISALESQRARIQAEFEKMPLTIERAWTRVRNAVMTYVGDADQASGASRTLAAAIADLADNLDVLTEAAAVLAVLGAARWLGPFLAAQGLATAAIIRQTYAAQQQVAVSVAVDQAFAKTAAQEARGAAVKVQGIAVNQAFIASERALAVAAVERANVQLAEARATLEATRATGSAAYASGLLRQAEQALSVAMRVRAAETAALTRLDQAASAAALQHAAATRALAAASTTSAAAQTVAAAATARLTLAARAANAALALGRGALALVGGWAGAAVIGLTGLYFWLNRSKTAADDLANIQPTVRSLRELADEADRFASRGPLISDEERASIEQTQERIRGYAGAIGVLAATRDRLAAQGDVLGAKGQQAEIGKLTELIREATGELQRFYAVKATGAGTEAINREIESLRRQIDLVRGGRSPSDAQFLEEFAAADDAGKQILALKKSLEGLGDAQRRAADSAKAAADKSRRAAEEYATKLKEIAALERQLALVRDGGLSPAEAVFTVQRDAADALGKKLIDLQRQWEGVTEAQRAADEYAQAEGQRSQTLRDEARELETVLALIRDGVPAAEAAAEARRLLMSEEERHVQALRDEADAAVAAAERLQEPFQDLRDVLVAAGDDWSRSAATIVQGLENINKGNRAAVRGYAQLTQGAAGFFKEGTGGYKLLQAASQAFYAFEIAQQAASVVASIAASGKKAAAHGVAANAAGAEAVATQAASGPIIGFAMAAAMIAFLASIGVSPRGKGGSAGARPSAVASTNLGAGTGTVLGDPEGRSESIANSLEALERYAETDIGYSARQLQTLRSIEAGIRGVGGLLFRQNYTTGGPTPFNMAETVSGTATGDIITQLAGINFGTPILNSSLLNKLTFGISGAVGGLVDGIIGGIVGGLFGSTTRKQIDTGIIIAGGQTLGDIMANGLDALYFATIETTKKKAFGLSKSRSRRDVTSDLSDDLTRQFTDILLGLGDSVIDAVEELGLNAQAAADLLNNLPLEIGKISLQGLTAEEVQERLSSVFSSIGDTFATTVVPAIAEFQRVGEGAYETLLRVASETAIVTQGLGNLGLSLTGLAGLDAARAAQDLIDLVGGIENFTDSISTFFSEFFSEEEQTERLRSQLSEALGDIGFALPSTRQGFRDLVTSLDLTTESGREAFAALLPLVGAADRYYDTLDDSAEKYRDAADRLQEFRASMRDIAEEARGQSLEAARLRFESVSRRARLGDLDAISALPDAGGAYQQASAALASSRTEYLRDLARIQLAAAQAEEVARRLGQEDVAQAQLAALNRHTELLESIDTRLSSSGAAITAAPTVAAGASGGAATDATELSALRAEIAELKGYLHQLTVYAGKTAASTRRLDDWDADGLPQERTA